jgi:hypothetical protein
MQIKSGRRLTEARDSVRTSSKSEREAEDCLNCSSRLYENIHFSAKKSCAASAMGNEQIDRKRTSTEEGSDEGEDVVQESLKRRNLSKYQSKE